MSVWARSCLCLLIAFGTFQGVAAQERLVLGVPLEPPSLDPTSGAAAAVDSIVYGNIFEGLTRLTQSGDVAPSLAESWDIAADGLTYVFHLRHGVRFHDGTEFDADDVRFSLERALASDSTNAQKALLSAIETVEVLDPNTVQLTLHRPSNLLLWHLGWGDAVIVGEESASENSSHPIGTGPFRFGGWQRGVAVRLERNDDYRGLPASFEHVVFQFIADPAAAYAAMKAGDIDAYPNYPAPENAAEFAGDPDFKLVIGATAGKVIMAMNNSRAPFDNLKVRQAISHAIDRNAIIEGAMFGYGEPIGSHYSRQDRAYVDQTARYARDIERSRILLSEAGYPDGFEATLRLPPRPYARRSGEIIAAQLAEVGIRLNIENIEWAQWLDQVFGRREYDLTIIEHIEPMDFGIYAREDYYFGYSDFEFDALAVDFASETDPTVADNLLRQIQEKIADDAVNIFLLQSAQIGVWRAGLNGLWVDTPIPANVASLAYFDGQYTSSGDRPLYTETGAYWLPFVFIFFIAVLLVQALRRMGAAWFFSRLTSYAATLFAATVVVFIILQILPGDPASYMMGMNASPESVAVLREQMGLESP
ncbi:MAG: ABC transporter substrate-binding protein, partial [Woeseiaceae bacterium]|nr:ABC transporter substrate-binding protein [Woeseiaceae bacterium]